jgi:hypothetical protein
MVIFIVENVYAVPAAASMPAGGIRMRRVV